MVAEMGFEPHVLDKFSAENSSSVTSRLCQSAGLTFTPARSLATLTTFELFALWSLRDIGLITVKVARGKPLCEQKIKPTTRVGFVFWLRRWDLNLMTFGL